MEINDPNAMSLATVDRTGLPNVRVVLLKGWDETGFVFYTNLESQKGEELKSSGKAAAGFHWKSLQRQVRIRGLVERVTDLEADEYFNSRHRMSRIGAWASQQSRPVDSRETMMADVDTFDKKYPGEDVPRPPHWTGSRIKPLYLEFWQDGDYRLHDRLIFERTALEDEWERKRLYP